jgi:hypothetical protein
LETSLTAEKTRKAGSTDSGPCKKKQCKISSTAHSKCNTAYQQKVHEKSHDLHQACAGAAAEQRRQINELKTNSTLTDEIQLLRAEHKDANKALMQQATKTESLPNTLSVTAFSSVLTSFADNAKKLIPVPNTAPAVAPAPLGSESTYSLAQLMKLKDVFK